MKNLYLLIFIFFFSFQVNKLQAQNWWDWRINQSTFSNLVIDKENNFIVASSSDGTNRALFKYNRDGLLQWKKDYTEDQTQNFSYGDGPINNQQETVSVDDSGNIYTTNAKFDDADNIVKLDANGNKIWGLRIFFKFNYYNRSPIRLFCSAMPNGELFIAGSCTQSDFYGDSLCLGGLIEQVHAYQSIFFAKIDKYGHPLWLKRYGHQPGQITFFPNFISCTKIDSKIYVSGDFCNGTLYFDTLSISSGGSQHNGFLVQLSDIDGHANWAKSIGPISPTVIRNTGGMQRYCYAFAGSNNQVLLGGNDGYTRWNYTTSPPSEVFYPSNYLRSYDSSGNELWVKHFAGFGTLQFLKKGDYYYRCGGDSIAKFDSAGNYIYKAKVAGLITIALSPVDETIGATMQYSPAFCKVLLSSNKVSGYVFRDANNNGIKDFTEKGISGVLVGKAPNKYIALSNSDGYYECYVDSGSHVISTLSGVRYNSCTPAAGHNTSFPGFGDVATDINFAFAAIPGINDLEIVTTPITTARPGFTVIYSTRVKNNGTENATGTAGIRLPVNAIYIADTNFVAPVYNSADSIAFSFTNLQPGEEKYYYYKCQLSASFAIGDMLTFYSAVLPVANDTVPADNYDTLVHRLRGSYDPNDKMVFPDGNLSLVEKNKPLSYTIRFQNTGNDTAFNVHLIDTLSEKLDITTIEMVGSSHSYKAKVEKGNVLHFYFDNINLADSFHNEALSHGFIRFKIKASESVTIGDEILNNASIYFDFNKPVVTNTTRTRYYSGVLPVMLKSFTANKNMAAVQLSFVTETENSLKYFEIEKSTDGNTFEKIAVVNAKGIGSNYQYTDTKPFSGINFYRLKLLFADGSFTYSAIQAVPMKTVKGINVFPNPAGNTLFFTTPAQGQHSYKIYSADGRLHFTGYNSSIQSGSIVSINTSFLAPGNYYLEITSITEREVKQFVIK